MKKSSWTAFCLFTAFPLHSFLLSSKFSPSFFLPQETTLVSPHSESRRHTSYSSSAVAVLTMMWLRCFCLNLGHVWWLSTTWLQLLASLRSSWGCFQASSSSREHLGDSWEGNLAKRVFWTIGVLGSYIHSTGSYIGSLGSFWGYWVLQKGGQVRVVLNIWGH